MATFLPFPRFGYRCPPLATAVVLAVSMLLITDGQAADRFSLSTVAESDPNRRVKVVVEVVGDLKLNPDGKEVTRLPLKVRGELLYDERILQADVAAKTRLDLRYYQSAEAAISVGASNQRKTLREPLRLVVAASTADGSRLFSPVGQLTRDELELIDIQGNSSLIERLLPQKEVALGEHWEHDDQLLAALLGLDVVHKNETKSTLRKVDKQVAVVDLEGLVSGAVSGVSSDVELKAVYNFDLTERRITWLAMSLQEDRAVGHAEPGFEVTARLRLATAAGRQLPQLSDQAVEGLDLAANLGSTLLEHSSQQGGFRFLHDRAWRVMIDRHDVSILRRVEHGDLVAQCNVSALPDLEPGKQPQLPSYQADVRRALGDNFGHFVEQSQQTTAQGLQVLRTVVAGAVSEMPIQWIYYHLSDEAGRQLALVFTMDARFVERFAENDLLIVDSVTFQTRQPPPQPVRSEEGERPEGERQAARPPSDPFR